MCLHSELMQPKLRRKKDDDRRIRHDRRKESTFTTTIIIGYTLDIRRYMMVMIASTVK